jgi:hypothetical protein
MRNYGKTLLTIALLTGLLAVSIWTIFDREYSGRIKSIENFVAPSVDTSGFSNFDSDYNYCPTDLRYDVYKLQEKFFKDTQDIVIRTVIHYFTNSDKSGLNDSVFRNRISLMNDFFRGSGADISFSLDTVIVHNGKPTDEPNLYKSITNFESFLGRRRNDLRTKYYGDHVDFHNNVFSVENALNIYVYNDDTQFSGRAGDIESTYFAVNLKYMHPELYTFEHEAGHCYGLYHTHSLDHTGERHSTDGGDFICETSVTFPLNSIVSDSCELISNWRENLRLPPYSNPLSSWDNITQGEVEMLINNIMSYSRHHCRQEFIPEQIKRMRKILENNKDLRSTIKGIDTDIKANMLRNLAEIY